MSDDKYTIARRPASTCIPLAEYFVVVGYATSSQKGGAPCGKILQRFPIKDWEDFPFKDNIEDFCQPTGWSLSNVIQEPMFFPFVLSDHLGNRQHCGCLAFYEPVAVTPLNPVDEEEETDDGCNSLKRSCSVLRTSATHHTIMYAPKSIVIISRLPYTEAFRQCLGAIYTVHFEQKGVELEVLVGNLLGNVYVPPAGGPQIRFSIGGGDRQALQPPLNASIPVTNCCVAQLFELLGINNALVLFCAVMTEHKIIFHSKSITRLNDACHALKSLMYPFEFTHTYVPHLPASTLDVCESPTPFIYGVHSSLRSEISGLIDVIIADLDGGSILVPDGIVIPSLPEVLSVSVKEQLAMVLHPELNSADFAFPPLALKPSVQFQVDKEVRAIFVRAIAMLFQGYRKCLVIIRIHPKPVIKLHKAKFLCQQGLIGDEFMNRLLDCMFFGEFLKERGCPWRPCDIWDDVHNALPDQLLAEKEDPKLQLTNIQEIAKLLALNENPSYPNLQAYLPKIVKPPEGAHLRVHAPAFPSLNGSIIEAIMQEEMAKQRPSSYSCLPKQNPPRIVPTGSKSIDIFDRRVNLMDNSARRLEVLRECINNIFEGKITDARKTIHAVIRSLKSNAAKMVLCQELGEHVTGNKAILESQQFDMVVKLMHCALQDNSKMDDYGIAAAMLPLATSFCRKLCPCVIQFAYTLIQDHPVWKNQQFWESAFYADAQKEVRALYIPREAGGPFSLIRNNQPVISSMERKSDTSPTLPRPSEISALDIAAEQLRMHFDQDLLNELAKREEDTIYSQVVHYAHRMVYFLIPLETSAKRRKETSYIDDDRLSKTETSVAESDSVDAGSAMLDDRGDPAVECRANVIRFVNKFVDHVCNEGGVTKHHKEALEYMIPGVVDMHFETLEAVHRESKRLPKTPKPKIPTPALLPGEELMTESLRVFLLPDGREDPAGGGGPLLLPAEGAVFVTNYRVVFKGAPCDPFACEQTIIRAIPIASLTKEKRFSIDHHVQLDQILQDGLQLRSATFQLLKLAFDESVLAEAIDSFRKTINKLRHPNNISAYFAFSEQAITATQINFPIHKDKSSTLKGFAKKTFMKTAKKVGIKPKSNKKQKYVFPDWGHGNGGTLPASTKYLPSPNKQVLPVKDAQEGDSISLNSTGSHSQDEEDNHAGFTNAFLNSNNDSKAMDKMIERSYYKDYRRLGLGTLLKSGSSAVTYPRLESFRISSLNDRYSICNTYPAMLVVPNLVNDDNIKKVARCYRGNRFPVIVWKHPKTAALLVRGASFSTKRVMNILRANQQYSAGGNAHETHGHAEQELSTSYLRAICNCTPSAVLKPISSWGVAESDNYLPTSNSSSHLSLRRDSNASQQVNNLPKKDSLTPDMGRKSTGARIAKAFNFNTLRSSGGRHFISGKPKKPVTLKTAVVPQPYSMVPNMNSDGLEPVSEQNIRPKAKPALYVFGKKSQMKGMKHDLGGKVMYVPVDVYDVGQLRTSFKRLMRACVPSHVIVNDPEGGYLKSVENTEWLQQLTCIIDLVKNVVDVIETQGASSMLCLEEGWDLTAQVSALSQLCMDPYYRTLEGFQTLLEKDWLAFGHKFARRNNMTGSDGPASNTNFTPVFIQFLDIVHQLIREYPSAFEFNQFYVKFMAYHSVSARFRTFLADNELERVEYGFLAQEDKRESLPRSYKTVDASGDEKVNFSTRNFGISNPQRNLGISIFEYIDKHHAKTALFYNFLYQQSNKTLNPGDLIGKLEIWDYFVTENLGTGPAFDLEVCSPEIIHEDDHHLGGKEHRKCVSKEVDNIDASLPDAFQHYLSEIHRMENDVGHLPQQWKQHWDRLDPVTTVANYA